MTNHRTRSLSAFRPTTAKGTGLVVLAALLVFSVFAFDHPRILTTVKPGEHLSADFRSGYKLTPFQSNVKLAGVKVGVVTGLERTASDGQRVEMKLDHGTRAKLGTEPRANIRPTLLLGGTYYVELVPGGADHPAPDGGTIPVSRTTLPVELDKVLSAVTPDASVAARGTTASLDETLRAGRPQVDRLLTHGPRTLGPASSVLHALAGTRPDQDLTTLVTSTRNTARALTRQDGQLGGIIDDLATTSGALASSRTALSRTVADAPATLATTRAGLADLDTTLDRLRTTATSFRPSARALDDVLGELGPVLRTARPVIADTRVAARDARPMVEQLVPTAGLANGVLEDVKGPVLERAKGPITTAVMSPWHGTGKYDGGGNDHPLYKETGYLLSNTASVFQFHDHNGASGRLMAGVGLSSVGGLVDHSVEEYLESLGLNLPKGPQDGATAGGPPGLSMPNETRPTKDPAGPFAGMLGSLLQLPLMPRSAR